MLQSNRVVETAGEAANIATELLKLHARVRKFLAFNSALAISFTPATKTGTYSTPTWTSTAHGLLVGQKVRLTSSSVLPSAFALNLDYYIIAANFAANTFNLSLTKGGAAVSGGDAGTGTHTVNPVPDYIVEETNGTSNLSGLAYDRTQVANAIGSITQFNNYMLNAAVTQGDHLGNLAQLARANGS